MLEISTAIAGAAVVRSCRTPAVSAVSGEPLNRCTSIPCTRSPNFLLNPRNGACARPTESTRSFPSPPANPNSHTRAPSPAIPSTKCAGSRTPRRAAHLQSQICRRMMDSHSPAASAPLEIRELQGSAHLRRQVQHDLALANSARAPRPRVRPPCAGSSTRCSARSFAARLQTEMQLAPQLRPAEKLPPVRQASSAAPARDLRGMDHCRAASASEPAPARKNSPHSNNTSHVKQHIKSVDQSTPLATSSRNEKGTASRPPLSSYGIARETSASESARFSKV